MIPNFLYFFHMGTIYEGNYYLTLNYLHKHAETTPVTKINCHNLMAENKLDDTVKITNSASIIYNFSTKAGKQLVLIIVLKLEQR